MTKIYFRQALNYTALLLSWPQFTLIKLIIINKSLMLRENSHQPLKKIKERVQNGKHTNSQVTLALKEFGQVRCATS